MTYIVNQQMIIDLLEESGIDPLDVQTLHLNMEESWVEVAVKDEKGNRLLNPLDQWENEGLYVTTVLPVQIASVHTREVI